MAAIGDPPVQGHSITIKINKLSSALLGFSLDGLL